MISPVLSSAGPVSSATLPYQVFYRVSDVVYSRWGAGLTALFVGIGACYGAPAAVCVGTVLLLVVSAIKKPSLDVRSLGKLRYALETRSGSPEITPSLLIDLFSQALKVHGPTGADLRFISGHSVLKGTLNLKDQAKRHLVLERDAASCIERGQVSSLRVLLDAWGSSAFQQTFRHLFELAVENSSDIEIFTLLLASDKLSNLPEEEIVFAIGHAKSDEIALKIVEKFSATAFVITDELYTNLNQTSYHKTFKALALRAIANNDQASCTRLSSMEQWTPSEDEQGEFLIAASRQSSLKILKDWPYRWNSPSPASLLPAYQAAASSEVATEVVKRTDYLSHDQIFKLIQAIKSQSKFPNEDIQKHIKPLKSRIQISVEDLAFSLSAEKPTPEAFTKNLELLLPPLALIQDEDHSKLLEAIDTNCPDYRQTYETMKAAADKDLTLKSTEALVDDFDFSTKNANTYEVSQKVMNLILERNVDIAKPEIQASIFKIIGVKNTGQNQIFKDMKATFEKKIAAVKAAAADSKDSK